MNTHNVLLVKVLRGLIGALFLTLLMVSLLSEISSKYGYAQEPEQRVLYREDFNDRQAQGWELGWRISAERARVTAVNYVLFGIEHYWARYAQVDWQDTRVRFRLSLEEANSVIHLNYRLSERGRYYIGFYGGGLYLSKESPWGTFRERLASSRVPHSYFTWHIVEIVGAGPLIQVIVDGRPELDYTDPEPLLSGTIAFETLEGTTAQVDDIIVLGLPPVQRGPDLAILSADNWRFAANGRVLVLLVEIANQGDISTPASTVYAEDTDRNWPGGRSRVQGLAPDETITVEVGLEIPDEQRGRTHRFRVEVDPEAQIEELDEENNAAITPEVFFPPVEVPPSERTLSIEAVNPTDGRCGTEMTLTVFGANFAPGDRVYISEGVRTLSTEVINPDELQARVSIAPQAPEGPRLVEVIGRDGLRVGLEGGFTVVCPTEPQRQPDLVIRGVGWKIAENGRVLVINADIRNSGDDISPTTVLQARAPGWEADTLVPELNAGESARVRIELQISEELRQRSHRFEVIVDPENNIAEWREDNNRKVMEVQPTAPPPRFPWSLLILIVAVLASLTISRTFKVRRRKEWQTKAKEEQPPETCQPCARHCRKIELELEPALRKIAHLTLGASDTDSVKQSKKREVKGKVVDGLNRAVEALHRGEKPEKLKKDVALIAKALLLYIKEWLAGEPATRDVSISGHLEGDKVTCQFVLYHCRRRGTVGVWEEEDRWKATTKDKCEEPVGTLRSLNPAEPQMPERLAPELARMMMQFIKKV